MQLCITEDIGYVHLYTAVCNRMIMSNLPALTKNVWLMCIEFSLARYSDTAVYSNNTVIDINLIGEGFEELEPKVTNGGALECHTDDTTCCRGIDNPDGPGRGEWYYPDGTVVPSPNTGDGAAFYRTRNHMVIRLNRNDSVEFSALSHHGRYRCEIPGAGGITIIRYITLSNTRGKIMKLFVPACI